TNVTLWPRSGTVLYARDLALELQRRGHVPLVFSSTTGPVAAELKRAGIHVTNRLSDFPQPDIIHGHHYAATLLALRRWPAIPAIYICHDHQSFKDRTPLFAGVRRHFGVSRLCIQRLIVEGVSPDRVGLLPNFVDTERFPARPPLPLRPRRALVFSNYASMRTHLPAVADACRRAGLKFDVAGAGVGTPVSDPERLLPTYDIVFAKAKAALEAMAVGNAVILCDFSGVGPMVTSGTFDELRALNFGFEALVEPLSPEPLLREIARYDPNDAARVRDLVHARSSLRSTVDELLAIYREVLADASGDALAPDPPSRSDSLRASLFLRVYWAWVTVPQRHMQGIKGFPGVDRVIAAIRRMV
ncbi:MAG: glycosyltransferase, partial [Chloroflexota bacterium]